MAVLDRFYFHGFIVSGFLSSVDADARSDYRVRHPDRPKHVMDAKGAAARGGQSASCLFLARNLTFPIQVDCKAVTLVAKASRRCTTKQAQALGPRVIYVLCWLTEFGDSQFVRCQAAGWLALVHFAVRLIHAQRSCIILLQHRAPPRAPCHSLHRQHGVVVCDDLRVRKEPRSTAHAWSTPSTSYWRRFSLECTPSGFLRRPTRPTFRRARWRPALWKYFPTSVEGPSHIPPLDAWMPDGAASLGSVFTMYGAWVSAQDNQMEE